MGGRFIVHVLLFATLFLLCGCGATTITLNNKCGYVVWPGIQGGGGHPALASGGMRLAAGESQSITAPSGWSGRVWGRTLCSFDTAGKVSCATGDCGGLLCNGAGGAPPATLAEMSLGQGQDFYDVSLVGGFKLPLSIVPRGNCSSADCAADLNRSCPSQLQVVSNGQVVACKSACLAFKSPQYCCSGMYASPKTCQPNEYSSAFKRACPTAYTYAFDDPSSLFTCSGADAYDLTFCPH